MKIAVLEKTNFSEEQISKLRSVGTVDFFNGLTQEEANAIAIDYDVVIVNWLDPNPFILNMKRGSLVALLSTGYGWISNLEKAKEIGVRVSNIPGYSTEAVAEHLTGMLLGVTKNIFSTINSGDNGVVGTELAGKTVGIIGLGHIGNRFAEIMQFFGAKVITYNRSKKNHLSIDDVTLIELLANSDVICITCSVNDESRNLINLSNIDCIKKGAIVIGSTWEIIEEDSLVKALKDGIIKSVAFDAALEASGTIGRQLLSYKDRVFLTPHIAYNTKEAEIRQLDICVENIISYLEKRPQNLV